MFRSRANHEFIPNLLCATAVAGFQGKFPTSRLGPALLSKRSLRNISSSRTFPNKIVCPSQCVFCILCVFKIKTHKRTDSFPNSMSVVPAGVSSTKINSFLLLKTLAAHHRVQAKAGEGGRAREMEMGREKGICHNSRSAGIPRKE